ncbi:MAG: glycosylase [Planctomycetia bacterium]|nr:glycosylase [Planctomycetia bacterium]
MNRREFNAVVLAGTASTLCGGLSARRVNGAVSEEVKIEEMENVYKEVKTPFKYGIVVEELGGHLVDSPGIFRKDGTWFMSFISQSKGWGYESFLAKSDDLLKWEFLGPLMSFREEGWDAWQAAAYPALVDCAWSGSSEMLPFEGKYWYTYLGGALKGYETEPLSIGMAWTENPTKVGELGRLEKPVLSVSDTSARWFEKATLYKSNVIWDRDKTLGHPFVMYYNAKCDGSRAGGRRTERIGMAVSDDLLTWTRFGEEPVIDNGTGISGDPQIVKIGDLWVMFYFGAFWRPKAFDTFAVSRDLVHWKKWEGPDLISPSEPWDATYAHKPWVVKWDGVVYHYYCAVGNRGRAIALATSEPIK